MAMIKCPECGKSVSEYAQACPECGYPISTVYGKKIVQTPAQAANAQNPKIHHFLQDSRNRLFALIVIGFSAFFVICMLYFSFTRPLLNKTNSECETSQSIPQESTRTPSSQQELITSVSQLTDSQLICDSNGIKIWVMNLILDKSYGDDNPYWVLTCYMENKSGHPLHTQFNNVDVNGGFGIDLRGINSEGNLSDGQKGIFHMHVAARDLTPYGITEIESMSGLVWIIDSDTWEKVVDDEPFSIIIDEIGNTYSHP